MALEHTTCRIGGNPTPEKANRRPGNASRTGRRGGGAVSVPCYVDENLKSTKAIQGGKTGKTIRKNKTSWS